MQRCCLDFRGKVLLTDAASGVHTLMMTSTSYVLALLIYVVAAAVGVRLIKQLLFPDYLTGWPALTGLITGLLVIPSFASSDASTLAPAFVTRIFNLLFAGGLETAIPALAMLVVGAIFGLSAVI